MIVSPEVDEMRKLEACIPLAGGDVDAGEMKGASDQIAKASAPEKISRGESGLSEIETKSAEELPT